MWSSGETFRRRRPACESGEGEGFSVPSKSEVFRMILIGLSAFNPALGSAAIAGAAGVEKLIKRDDDPTNDLDETADAVTEIAMAVVTGAEGLGKRDYVNDPILKQLAENIKGDIKIALLVVNKPVAAPPAIPPAA
jgi:hypothetical protein